MKTREEYVQQLKQQLDGWNADVTRWEAQLKEARANADQRWRKDLEKVRDQREKALYNLTLLEKASATAWRDVAKGADAAWDALSASLEQARAHFEKQPPKR